MASIEEEMEAMMGKARAKVDALPKTKHPPLPKKTPAQIAKR